MPNEQEKQVIINISDSIPPQNIATIDKDGAVGNTYTKAQFDDAFSDKSEEIDTKIENIQQMVESDFKGTLKPSDAAPTEDGSYKPEISSKDNIGTDPVNYGTLYANAGNLRAKEGYETMFYKKGSVWTKAETKMPQSSDKIDTWVAGSYSAGKQVIYSDQSVYEANAAVTSSDVPGVSTKWTKKVGVLVSQVFNPSDNEKPSTMKAAADRWDRINLLIETKSEIIATSSSMTWVDGEYYNANGTTGNNPSNWSRSTNYINVVAGDTYGFLCSATCIIWYNDSNVVVGSSGNPTDAVINYREYVAPSGATKARVNIVTVNKSLFEFKHRPSVGEYQIKSQVIKLGDIAGVNVLYTEIANYASCTWVAGYYLSTSNVPTAFASFNYCSNYIPVVAGQSYTFRSSGTCILWYTSAQVFISAAGNPNDGSAQRTFTAPAGAAFCRVNQANENIQGFSLRLATPDGNSENIQIPRLQINGNQVIGGISGGGNIQAQLAKIGDVKLFNFTAYPLTGNVITSGDSTIAAYNGGLAVSTIIKSTGTITDISVPGETITQQLGHWNALSASVRSVANYVFVQIGLNDLGPSTGDTLSTINALKNYIAKIRSDSPSSVIVVGEMLPCRQRFINLWGTTQGETAYQKWKALNTALPTITGVSKIATVHGWLLNDGNDSLKGEFDTGDAIHENTNGRKMIAYSWIISTL